MLLDYPYIMGFAILLVHIYITHNVPDNLKWNSDVEFDCLSFGFVSASEQP